MSNLRVVRAEFLHEGNEGDLRSAQLTPLQQTVNVQAARIVDLEQKLAKAEEIYDLVQAQQRYIVEMESTLATMEGDLNAKQREESNYKESYNDIIRNNTELKMAKEGLVSDCDRLSCEKAELLEQIKGLQGRAVAKMIIDWNRTLLTKVFENWRKDATETANYKRVVLKFKAKMMNACIWRCYRSWVNLVAENVREKKVLNKFRARMLNLTVTRSFNSWCGFVADRLRLKKLGLKIFNKVVLGELYSGWSQFCSQILLAKDAADEFLQHQKKQERDQLVLLKFCNRMVRKTLCDCFDSIKNNWVVRKKTRRLLNRYFGPMESDFVKCAWRIWRDNCRDLSFAESASMIREKNEEIESLKARLELLEDKTQNLALSKAKSMIQMWQNKCLINCLNAWITFVKEAVEENTKMRRFVAKWRNATVAKCFLAWQIDSAEEKRNRVVLGRFLQRMQNNVLAKCFVGWGWFARENIKERGILKKFRARMQNMCAARAFASWVAFKLESRRVKVVAFKVMARVGNVLLAAAFGKWSHNYVSELEEEKEAERQRKVLEKFVNRMQLSCVVKCVGQWREFVRERKFLRLFVGRMVGGMYFALMGDGFRLFRRQVAKAREAENNSKNSSWKKQVSDNIKELQGELQMHSQLLLEAKGLIDRKDKEIAMYKELITRRDKEIAVYQKEKKSKTIYHAFETWNKHWNYAVRDCWIAWKNRIAFLNKVIKSRNIMRILMLNTINYNYQRAMRKWKDLVKEKGVEEEHKKMERRINIEKATNAIKMLEQNRKNFGLDDLSDVDYDDDDDDDDDVDDYDDDGGGGGGGGGGYDEGWPINGAGNSWGSQMNNHEHMD